MPTADILVGLEALTKEYFDKLKAFKPTAEGGIEEIEAYIDTLAAEIGENEFMKAALDAENANSPAAQYTAWHDAMYPPAA